VAPNTTVTGATVAATLSGSTLTATLSGTVPGAGSYSGFVTLKGTGVSLRLPYLFIVGNGTAYNANPIFSFAGGTPGTDGGPLAVQVPAQSGAPVANSPVFFSLSPRGSVTLQGSSGEPTCTPASSPTSITCPTDNYGIAYVDVTLGSAVSSP